MVVRTVFASLMISVISTRDRKSTRLNSSHSQISYAVFCLKKKSSTAPGVVDVDPTTGKIAAKSRGFAVVSAIYGRVQGQALVIASLQLELSLLLDLVYLMR